MQLFKSLTTVTSLSKALTLVLFSALPLIGFILGIEYQELKQSSDVKYTQNIIQNNKPNSPPDATSNEPADIGTYGGVPYGEDILTESCIDSGGKISTSLCCKATKGFMPDTCLIGACDCSPDNSDEITVCDCGKSKCFDGNKCVYITE